MSVVQSPEPIEGPPGRVGGGTLVVILLAYLACAAAITYPLVRNLTTALPESKTDPLQHLWVMRWYRTALLEGRNPWVCPELQYPVGAPLGNFSPMHLQGLLYLPLSLAFDNDYLCYNLIYLFGFVFTGFGTFLLAWHVLRNRPSAAVAGLLVMLCAPMRLHAVGHLELIYLGGFPLFLLAWMRFVDRPGRGRMIAAALAYVLVAMCAAYFMVFAIFPAVLYALGRGLRAGRRGIGPWLRERLPWLVGFAGLASPFLIVLFSGQLWAAAHGQTLTRPRSEFELYAAPWWSYAVPLPGYRLGKLLPADAYAAAGMGETAGERCSYLGAVTLLLVAFAAARRVKFPRAAYWWSALAMLVVLSMGAYVRVGGQKLGLPAGWLNRHAVVFRLIRVPARFNLFAAVIAALIAAAGLKHLLARIPRRGPRAAVVATLAAVAIGEMAVVPMAMIRNPGLPACYAMILARDPRASVLEIPHPGSWGTYLAALTGYWQGHHGARSSGGYAGLHNSRYDDLITYTSPFYAARMAEPGYLADPGSQTVDLVSLAPFDDYVWLYLTVHRFDYVVLHQWAGSSPEHPNVQIDRLKPHLEAAKVFEDAATAVYARDRLPTPRNAVILPTDGWRRRFGWKRWSTCPVERVAHLMAYNPEADRDLILAVDSAGFKAGRTVRLRAGDLELDRWEVPAEEVAHHVTRPFRIPAGLVELTLESDGEEAPRRSREEPVAGDRRPFSLRVVALGFGPAPAAVAARPDAEKR